MISIYNLRTCELPRELMHIAEVVASDMDMKNIQYDGTKRISGCPVSGYLDNRTAL